MKNKIPVLLVLFLLGLTAGRGEPPDRNLIAEAGFISRYSLDSGSRIHSVVLGIKSRIPVYYKIEYRNRVLAGGKFTTGVNVISLAPEALNLHEPGEKKLLLILKPPTGIPDTRQILIGVEVLDTPQETDGAAKTTVYSLRMFYEDEFLLALTHRLTEDLQESERVKKSIRQSPEFSNVPRINTPEDEALYYSRYAVSFLDLAALGIRQIVRGVQQVRDKAELRPPSLTTRLTGRVAGKPGSPFSDRKVKLTLTLRNPD